MLIVKKYGGSSVSSPEKIMTIAQRLKGLSEQGHKIIVIVSAMGDTTNQLVAMSQKITLTPHQREMDMLLSSGERITMALLSIALNNIGCSSQSFTGSQSGLMTDGNHSNAKICDIKPIRITQALEENKIAIIAGFQGVNPVTKEVTTLGRGGSDTTAVAVASHFKADQCEILTDVEGLYSANPNLKGVKPQIIPQIDYMGALEATYWGAGVLHYRCVELAERHQIPFGVCLSSKASSGTIVEGMESVEFKTINYISSLGQIRFEKGTRLSDALKILKKGLKDQDIPFPQVVYQREKEGVEIFVSVPEESLQTIASSLKKACEEETLPAPEVNDNFGSVTLTGRGFQYTAVASEISHCLTECNIEPEALVTTPLSLSFIVPTSKVKEAAAALHDRFVS